MGGRQAGKSRTGRLDGGGPSATPPRRSNPAMRYAIGLGGNLGDVPATAARALDLLAADGIATIAVAAWRTTAPVGGPPQPAFRNSAAVLATGLGPHGLLAALQRAESACGRNREVRWGPRTLDLDLLLAEDGTVAASPVLTLPHPRLHERAFVLDPLAEVASGWRHTLLGATVAELAWRLGAGR